MNVEYKMVFLRIGTVGTKITWFKLSRMFLEIVEFYSSDISYNIFLIKLIYVMNYF